MENKFIFITFNKLYSASFMVCTRLLGYYMGYYNTMIGYNE